jgi:hypothetical protein
MEWCFSAMDVPMKQWVDDGIQRRRGCMCGEKHVMACLDSVLCA